MNVRIARDRHEVAGALASAGELLTRTGAPFCAQPMWLSTWYGHCDAQPLAVVVERDAMTAGLACLAIGRTGPLRTVTLAGDGPSDYARLPVWDGECAVTLADGVLGVLARIRGPWRLRLSQLPVDDPVARLLRDALPGGRLAPGQACPAMTFGEQRLLERHMTAKGRRAARRGRSRLDEAGVSVRVERTREPAGVRELLPEIVSLHRSRDRSLGRRSDLDEGTRRAFYLETAQALADAGQLDIWTLRLDGELGAFVVGVRDGGSYRALDARIGELWPNASPGQVLRTDMITALLAEPELAELDWMRGELRHKLQDATHVVATEQLLAESSPLVRTAVNGWGSLRQGVRDRVPNQTRVWLRSRVNASAQRFPAKNAERDAGPAVPRQPGASDDNRARF